MITKDKPRLSHIRFWRAIGAPWRALKREWRSLLEFYLVPSLVVLLPWKTAYGLLRWFVENTSLYSDNLSVCVRNARRLLPGLDEEEFIRRHKMLRLLDLVDPWLMRFRPNTANAITELESGGQWPEAPGFLILCHHWGAGLLGLHHLRQQGRTPLILFVADPLSVKNSGLLSVLHQKIRRKYFYRLSGGKGLAIKPGNRRTPDAWRLLQQTTKHPMIMVDVPRHDASDDNSLYLQLGGKKWRYPVKTGFTRLITEQQRAYTLMSVRFNYATGRRCVRLVQENHQTRKDLLQQFADKLNAYLAEDPAQWQFWHVAGQILVPVEDEAGTS